jgi:hypothetical protein
VTPPADGCCSNTHSTARLLQQHTQHSKAAAAGGGGSGGGRLKTGPKVQLYMARSIIELISRFDASARITVLLHTMFLEELKIKGFGAFKQREKREATAEVYKLLQSLKGSSRIESTGFQLHFIALLMDLSYQVN